MADLIKFEKWHGLGNDFVIVDYRSQPGTSFPACKAQRIADRRVGIGCDQLLTITPATDGNAAASVAILNSDGSPAEQCGNGMRCIAAYLARAAIPADNGSVSIHVQTQGGLVKARVDSGSQVTVDLGEPDFEPGSLPFEGAAPGFCQRLELEEGTVEFRVVSMGNPHAVIRVPDVSAAAVASIGSKLGAHASFPEGVNVGFMEVQSPRQIGLRVFERGAGETQACGSGACAAVAAGVRDGWLEGPVTVLLPGGKLVINWRGPGEGVSMTGPATYVYSGEIEI